MFSFFLSDGEIRSHSHQNHQAQEGLISTEEAKTFLDIMARQQDPQNIGIHGGAAYC